MLNIFFSVVKPYILPNMNVSRAHGTYSQYLACRRHFVNVSGRNCELLAVRDHVLFSLFYGPLIGSIRQSFPPSVLSCFGEPRTVYKCSEILTPGAAGWPGRSWKATAASLCLFQNHKCSDMKKVGRRASILSSFLTRIIDIRLSPVQKIL